MSLKDIPMLDASECAELCERIYSLRQHWEQRNEFPFFTLGAASYIDATNGRAASYREKAQRLNPVLRESFSDLYQRLGAVLEAEFGSPFLLSEEVAFPGFHVFLAHPSFAERGGSVHFDLQFENIDWSAVGEIDPDRQLSLTLSLRLPAAGSGLLVWEVDNRDLRSLPAAEKRRTLDSHRTPTLHPYQLGTLVMHPGHLLHQIPPLSEMVEGDQRITLQAHALPTSDGHWVMYW